MLTYVLELEHDCWYIGRTTDIHRRMGQHFNCKGAKWCGLHKPIRIAEIRKGDVEKETTLEYMQMHGWERVRGGPWCQVRSCVGPKSLWLGKTLPMAITNKDPSVIKSWAISPPQTNIHGGKFWSIQTQPGAKSHPKFQLGGDNITLRTPFGCHQFSTDSKHTLDLEVTKWMPERTFLEKIDEWVLDSVFERQSEFFPKSKPMSREALVSIYSPLLSQKGDFEPLLRCKINPSTVPIWKVLDGPMTTKGSANDLTAGAQIVPIVSLSKLWVMSGRFGITSYVEAAMCWPKKERELGDIFSTSLVTA